MKKLERMRTRIMECCYSEGKWVVLPMDPMRIVISISGIFAMNNQPTA